MLGVRCDTSSDTGEITLGTTDCGGLYGGSKEGHTREIGEVFK